MKYIQCIFTIILVLLLLFNGGVDILAVDMGFSTESMSEDEIETFLKNVNISILENEPSKKAIDCFDVNENGEIAIGSSDFENQTVFIRTMGILYLVTALNAPGTSALNWIRML